MNCTKPKSKTTRQSTASISHVSWILPTKCAELR